MFRTRLLALTLGFALIAPATVLAQDSTPVTGGVSCDTVAPRDAADLQAVAGTPPGPGADTASPMPAAIPFVMPQGEAVSGDDQAAVVRLYETLTACVNAGDFLRVAALYTDGYLQRNLSPEMIENLETTPEPNAAAMQTALVAVQDARYLDQDRIGALVVTHNAQTGDLLTYAEVVRAGNGWLIDQETVLETGLATPEA